MFKKLLALGFIAAAIAFGMIPVMATRQSEAIFKNPGQAGAPAALKKAIESKIKLLMFSRAKEDAERGVMLFPESEQLDYFIYYSGHCAQMAGKPGAARYWFRRFIRVFPQHSWRPVVEKRLERIKG